MIEGKCLNLEMLEGLGSSAVETLNPKPTPKPPNRTESGAGC